MDSTICYTPILWQALCYMCTMGSEYFPPERVLVKMQVKNVKKKSKHSFLIFFSSSSYFFKKGACEQIKER